MKCDDGEGRLCGSAGVLPVPCVPDENLQNQH